MDLFHYICFICIPLFALIHFFYVSPFLVCKSSNIQSNNLIFNATDSKIMLPCFFIDSIQANSMLLVNYVNEFVGHKRYTNLGAF